MELGNKAVAEYVWPGRITQVIDPQYFWMQLGTRENLFQFEQLQQNLQMFARQNWAPVTSVDELEPGMVVLVDTGIDNQSRWKRGQVAGVMHGNNVDVFYVDYGNTELTTVDKICMNMPTQFKVCPPQAVRCSLAGVKPLVKKWTSRGIKTFQHLTGSGLLNVLVLYGEPGYCEVALYPSEEENGQSVGHCLIAEEVAMMMDEQMIPEFLQEIPAFMTQGFPDTVAIADSSPPIKAEEQHIDSFPRVEEHQTEADTKVHSTPPSTEKYIPPHQKNLGSPSGSAGSSLTGHGASLQNSPSDSSVQKYSKSSAYTTQHSSGKKKEPVNDFFPFENVSVYPPSPSSPVKSPGRGSGYTQSDQGQNGSYFSRSPKYEQYGMNAGYRHGHSDRYTGHVSNNVAYSRQPYSGRHHEKSRFAANFDNLPQPANTFEPGYMNHQRDREFDNAEAYNNFSGLEKKASGLHKSPNKSFSDSDTGISPRPRLHIPGSNSSQAPFYPPDQRGESSGGYAAPKTWNHTSQQMVEQTHQPYALNPPAYYQPNIPPPPLNQSDQYFNHYDPSVSPVKHHSGIVSSSPVKIPHHNDHDARPRTQHFNNNYHDNRHQDSAYNSRLSSNGNQYNDQNNSNNQHSGKPAVRVQMPTTPNKYLGYEPPKLSPESPDSPAIAAFNLGDLEHTQMTSTDHFHQQLHQERLQALQEEAEDIARESKEQSELVNYSRYGARGQRAEEEEYVPISDLDVFDQIAQEIQNTSVHSSKESEKRKTSPVKNTGKPKEADSAVKLEGIPQSYIADINFTEAVREALESGRTDMDNARSLLSDIVESLKFIDADKQLYDVLLLMLAKAVKEYDLFNTVVMDTINTLNGEMEIKDCLAKALKRQQELCVRVPAPRKPQHLDLAKVMGHVYNMALEWSDSNASIQDGILVTVEKWIVFNNKGSQIGQLDKENVFLDCFGAFWEVSGTKVMQHNQDFKSRIREEIRKKLLNESVSRSIRERLLDITLELFSHNVEKRNVSTQTQRRTMIPSSCQVKPSTCDKTTCMESEWQDEGFTNLDPGRLEMSWQVNTDYASPDPVLNLRPMGRGQGVLQKVSTPHDSSSSNRTNDTLDTLNLQDLSRNSDFNESVYVTPNESFVSNAGKDKPKLHDLINRINETTPNFNLNVDSTKKNLSESFRSSSAQGEQAHRGATGKTEDTAAGVEPLDQNVNQNRNTGQSVAEQKSAMGKSLVDWFDYEPSATDSNRNGAKLEEKRLETKKKLDSTSMEIIENDVALKYAPTKDLGKKKSKKEKDKKLGKNTSMSLADERRVEGNKVVEESSYDQALQKAIIESLQTEDKDIVSNAEELGRNVVKKVDQDIDWWGVGEAADTRYFADSVSEPLEDNIYIDNGPDVIIEDEFEQGGDDFENDQIKSNRDINSESLGATNCEKPLNNINECTENVDKCLSNSFEETEIGGHELLLPPSHDEFAFDVDDNDENWDSESSEDLNVNAWVGLQQGGSAFAVGIAETDIKTVIPPIIDAAFVEPVEESVAERQYESNFPKTNLGDFVKVTDESETEERPRNTRWVPGRRKCMSCHSEDHTTESCKEGFLILQ